ncbi:hypothetical protein RHO12_02940 [Orbus sturtevantii]|uniref:hypothetical protein n=1 Tax=Orbus sturtevantii TaxID=3074109 RepID=UPI00370D4433
MLNGNTLQGDGYKYRGRGLVQLTWKNNYQAATNYFNIDFINNPDKASEYGYAVPIMILAKILDSACLYKCVI